MKLTLDSNRSNLIVASVAALSVTGLWFWLTWRYGFDLSDEGFYWYGAQRVLRGEVPLRDFMSYDIGRYYWAASFMHLIGDDGVFAARVSAAAYQFFGPFLGTYVCLLALRRDGIVRWVFALLVACILTVWVVPYYKAYDHATSVIIVAMLVLMLKVPQPAAWLAAGVCLGISAIMGRNHGVYGAFAAMLLVAVLFIKAPSRRALIRLCGYFFLGVLIGFSPTLIMMLAVDGFSGVLINSILSLFQKGVTNIGLPVPWPWAGKWEWVGVFWTALKLSTGLGFVFLIALPLLGILALAYRRFDLSNDSRKVFFAAIACAIPYAHYAFSRADLTHLALGIFPALIGLLAASASMSGLRPLALSVAVLLGSVLTVSNLQPYFAPLSRNKLLQADVGEQRLWVFTPVFWKLQLSTRVLSDPLASSGTFLALPNMPSLHAIYRTRMPTWEIYPLYPRSAEFETREIKRLESSVPDMVLLSDHALDGNSDFRYSHMRPQIFAWIASRYQLSEGGETAGISDFKVFRLRQ